MPDIALTPEIEQLAAAGAWFVFSSSGGKDSGAALHAGNAWLDTVGHPRARRLSLHADLRRAEWPDTLDTVRAVAAHSGMACEVVGQERDLLWRFEDRWRRCLARYVALETIAMPPPWSSSSSLFCRSEQKAVELSKRKARLDGDLPIVGITGLRREESPRRATTAIVSPDGDLLRRNGRHGLLWNPLVDWRVGDVFAYHEAHGVPLHRAYRLGSSRLSCAYCVLASLNDATVSYRAGNLVPYRAYVALETRSAFPFQLSRWLADLVDDPHTDRQAVTAAKAIAAERTAAQATLPRSLLQAKSIINITEEDAATLGAVRKRIGDLYGIRPLGVDGPSIMRMSRGEMVDG